MQTLAFSPLSTRDVYSVTRLNREARAILEGNFPVLWIEGEISNLSRPASGHLYFSLKDAQCQVRCAMFRNRNWLLHFTPENGLHVVVRAEVSLYEGRGEFQLIVQHMEPAGDGALRLAFERLKQKLYAEGLFSEAHKIGIPVIPRAIGVITSPTGAAIRDILSILRRRFPAVPVVIYPVPVQGAEAPAAIARAIAIADQRKECDVLILARGGGSLEDLWAFNEEGVARALYACELPIVAGIGHEIDFTIADLVADRRAPTPSASAELVSPDQGQLLSQLNGLERRLWNRMQVRLDRSSESIKWLSKRLVHPSRRLHDLAQRLDELSLRLTLANRAALQQQAAKLATSIAELQRITPLHSVQALLNRYDYLNRRLIQAMGQGLERQITRIAHLGQALHSLSPLATLERGYAIVTTRPDGQLVRDASSLKSGSQIQAQLARGRIHCEVVAIFESEIECKTNQR
jgi:exodeoxyribonuclease VII large subunit